MSTDIKRFLQQAPKHIRDAAIRLADEITTGTDFLARQLHRLDDKVLQQQAWSQFVAEYAKELYRSGIQQYADSIIKDCSDNQNGRLQCISGGFLYVGLGGLNARNPLSYVKAMYLTCVTGLWKDGLLTQAQAQQFRSQFEMVFLLADIAKRDRMIRDLDITMTNLQSVRRTASGDFDKRFRATKTMLRLMRDSLKAATSQVGKTIVEWKKLQAQ